jgi:hypothetical protein
MPDAGKCLEKRGDAEEPKKITALVGMQLRPANMQSAPCSREQLAAPVTQPNPKPRARALTADKTTDSSELTRQPTRQLTAHSAGPNARSSLCQALFGLQWCNSAKPYLA